MIDSAGFADLRGYLKRRIACARFRVGSTYYTVPLSGIDILADGTVRARVSITGAGRDYGESCGAAQLGQSGLGTRGRKHQNLNRSDWYPVLV